MLLSVPCPSLRSPSNLVVVDETAPRSPKTTEIYRTLRWIHSVLLLLRIPSRVRLVPESSKDPAELNLPRISARLCLLAGRCSRTARRSRSRGTFGRVTRYPAELRFCLDRTNRRSRSKSKGESYHDRRYIPFNVGIRDPEKRCRTGG